MELSTRRWGPRHRRRHSEVLGKYDTEAGGRHYFPHRHEDGDGACCGL